MLCRSKQMQSNGKGKQGKEAGASSVTSLLAQHAARVKAREEEADSLLNSMWMRRWAYLTAASVTVWGVFNAVDNELSDPEACREWAWEPGWRQWLLDISCSRLGTHCGPVDVRKLEAAGIAEEALRRLATGDLDVYDSFQALARIEQQTSRGAAVHLDFTDFFRQIPHLDSGLFDTGVRIMLDVLSRRTVSCPDMLADIVATNFGSSPRYEELKAWIIYLLLLHPDNALRALKEPLLMEWMKQDGRARREQGVRMPGDLTSGELHDILIKSWKLVQAVDPSLPDLPQQHTRETLDLEQKIDLHHLQTSLGGTFIFSLAAAMCEVQGFHMPTITRGIGRVAVSVIGIGLWEVLFRVEEAFLNRRDELSPHRRMLTFGYALVHSTALALTWRFAPLALFPLGFIHFVKDPLGDTRRLLTTPSEEKLMKSP